MALAYSNLVSGSANSALNKKLNTKPLQALTPAATTNAKKLGLGSTAKIAPLTVLPSGASLGGGVTTAKPAAPVAQAPQAAPIYQQQTTTPTTTGLMSSIQTDMGSGNKGGDTDNGQKQDAWAALRAKRAVAEEQAKQANTPTYSGLVGDLSKLAKTGTPGVQQAIDQLTGFRQNAAEYKEGIYSAPTSARVMQGRQSAVQQANAERENALASGVSNALTSQGQQLTALQGAAGLAAPIQAPYGNQVLSPLSGDSIQQGMGGGALNPVTAIPSYAQQVASGAMSYDQAVSALGGNAAFTSALNSAIQQINPNFSPVQSNANAAVQGQTLAQTAQQSNALQLASGNAYKALDLLSDSYNKLSGAQKTPVPLANKAANLISTQLGVGSGATQAYQTSIQEARAAVSQVLSAVGNTPTYSEATAYAIIPDNAGQEQIAAAIRTVEKLIEQKTQSYSAPGVAPQYGGIKSAPSTNVFAEEW